MLPVMGLLLFPSTRVCWKSTHILRLLMGISGGSVPSLRFFGPLMCEWKTREVGELRESLSEVLDAICTEINVCQLRDGLMQMTRFLMC